MKIDINTKISSIIKHDKRAIDAIASISSHFNKLKNPILRKVLAPRVTIADAARIGKCEVDDLYGVLTRLGFEVEATIKTEVTELNNEVEKIDLAIANDKVKTLDVRPILDSGSDPFEHIQDAFQDMENGFVLEILNTFEPTPLINIMRDKGIECTVKSEGELIKTYFYKESTSVEEDERVLNMIDEERMKKLVDEFGEKVKEIDVRHLEMPEPMVTILQEVEKLATGELLFVHHKKVPQYLLPELEQRNLNVYLVELGSNNVKLLIH